MSNVISIAAVRSEKLRQALSTHGRKGETVIIDTRIGTITAEKITCRDRFAEILNTAGDFAVVDYKDIRSLQPVVSTQTSIVSASGEFLPVKQSIAGAGPVPVLPFVPGKRRRP
jgi:hypothetical protein